MAGLSPNEFWELTPLEVALHVLGFMKRMHLYNEMAAGVAGVVAKSNGAKRCDLRDLIKEYEDPLV